MYIYGERERGEGRGGVKRVKKGGIIGPQDYGASGPGQNHEEPSSPPSLPLPHPLFFPSPPHTRKTIE